jgi:SAM-dependent methyltransferase
MSPFYASLEAGPEDVVVDVGCGTGDALRHLDTFAAYHGFDVDPGAIEFARRTFGERPGVHFAGRVLEPRDLQDLRPTKIVLAGLLHHLDDATAKRLLAMFASSPSVQRIITQDVVLLPGEHVSNLLARLDRGNFVRRPGGYRALAEAAGLEVESARLMRSHPETGRARYFVMTLSRSSP